MGRSSSNDDFKRDAVAQITERGYPVAEASERLDGSCPERLDLIIAPGEARSMEPYSKRH
jgi:hypothetical protein